MDETSVPFTMPVAPAGYSGGGFGGGFGNDWAWIIILLLAFGGGFGGYGGGFGMDAVYPWLNNSQNINDGFRDQMLGSQVSGIQNAITSGFGDVATQLCGGFAGVTASVTGAQNALASQLYNNEIASLNRSFAEQTANTQGFTGLQSQLATCCCENRSATQDVKYTIATEAAATRSAIQGGIQTILDKMCQDKIDAKNEKIVELNNKINSLESNNYIQNALTAQTQYFLGLYPPPTAA